MFDVYDEGSYAFSEKDLRVFSFRNDAVFFYLRYKYMDFYKSLGLSALDPYVQLLLDTRSLPYYIAQLHTNQLNVRAFKEWNSYYNY